MKTAIVILYVIAIVQAVGTISLFDWRATLQFLASLHHQDEVERNLLTSELKPYIIDRFNTHITRGRRRNLAHSMLCHLAGRMRIRIILTTNFDTLIEDAFTESGEPIRPLRVSTQGDLPDASTVHGLNCCVKLHGELHETRADYSLDDFPPAKDLNTFYQYLTGGPQGRDGATFIPSHVLVCGYSGSDHRCVRMLEYALSKDKRTQVFWIFHTKSAAEAFSANSRLASDEFKGRMHVTWTDRTDLLLYELYQRITLSLPRGGFNYQLNHNYPPVPVFSGPPDAESSDKPHPLPDARVSVVTGVCGALVRMQGMFNSAVENRKECIWLELEDYADVFGLAHELFQIVSLRSGNYEIGRTTFIPSQAKDDNRALKPEDWAQRIQRVMEAWQLNPEDHVVFLYGRNGPGGCKGWEDDWDIHVLGEGRKQDLAGDQTMVPDWSVHDHYWKKEEYHMLEVFIEGLSMSNFKVIYAPYNEERDRGMSKMFAALAASKKQVITLSETETETETDDAEDEDAKPPPIFAAGDEALVFPQIYCHEYKSADVKSHDVRDRVTAWPEKVRDLCMHMRGLRITSMNIGIKREKASYRTGKKDEFEQLIGFLFKMTLIRQSRHPASLISEAVIECPSRYNACFMDNDVLRNEMTSSWLSSRWLGPLLRQKRGGYIWIYRDTRLALRLLALGRFENLAVRKDVKMLYRKRAAVAHYGIAEWYHSAFCSTGHAEPLMEALYHYWQTALYSVYREPSPVKKPKNHAKVSAQKAASDKEKPNRASGRETTTQDVLDENERCWHLFTTSLSCLIKAMRLGRTVLAFWSNEREARALFDFTLGRPQNALKRMFATLANFALEKPARLEEGRDLIRMLQAESRRHISPFSTLSSDTWDVTEWIYTSQRKKHGTEDVSTSRAREEEPKADPSFAGNSGSVENTLREISSNWEEEADLWANLMEAWRLKDDNKWLSAWLDKRKVTGIPHTVSAGIDHEFLSLWQVSAPLKDFFQREVPAGDGEAADALNTSQRRLVHTLQKFLKGMGPFDTPQLAEHLFEMTYSLVRRAKLLERLSIALECDKGVDEQSIPHGVMSRMDVNRFSDMWKHDKQGFKKAWLDICALCRTMLDLSHGVHPNLWEHDFHTRIKVLSTYGLALGRLGRFHEARRRLNEAHAICTRLAPKESSREFGIISLRCAEVDLLEARFINDLNSAWHKRDDARFKKKTPRGRNDSEEDHLRSLAIWYKLINGISGELVPLAEVHRLCTAKVDDAWLHLESADQRLRGHSQSAHWWGRLASLQFRAYVEGFAFAASSWWDQFQRKPSMKSPGSGTVGGSKSPQYRSLTFRHPREARALLESQFRRAEGCQAESPYSMLRTIHSFRVASCYAFEAVNSAPTYSRSFTDLFNKVVEGVRFFYKHEKAVHLHDLAYYRALEEAGFFDLSPTHSLWYSPSGMHDISFTLIEKFDGEVLEVDRANGTFVASLSALTCTEDEQRALLSLHDLSSEDQKQVKCGCRFTLTIGHRTEGTTKKRETIFDLKQTCDEEANKG